MTKKAMFLWDAYRLSGPGSGIFTYVQMLAKGFSLIGDNPLIVADSHLAASFPLNQKLIAPPFAPSRLYDSKIVWPHRLYREIAPKGDFRLWHGMANINLPFLFEKKNTRFVLTIHDLIPLLPDSGCSLSYKIQFAYALSRVLKYADAVVTVSDWTAKLLRERYPKELGSKLCVIKNAASFDRMRPRDFESPLREEASSFLNLLCISRHEPYKGLSLIPKILRLLPDFHRLTLVSDRAGLKLMNNIAPDLMATQRLQVKTLVAADEMAGLWQMSDLYLHPSRYEGFGLPVYEALSHGCPVLYRRGHAFDGVIGEELGLSLGDDPAEWADGVHFLADYRKKAAFAIACKEFFDRENTWLDAANSLKKLYNSLI